MMGWYNYYTLLEKYDGDLSRATKVELEFAARANPDNPPDALALAMKEFERNHPPERREAMSATLRQEAEEAVSAEVGDFYIAHPTEASAKRLFAAAVTREERLRKIAIEARDGMKKLDGPAYKIFASILSLATGKE